MTIAVPVSWHIGRTPPAAMFAFFSRSRATNWSLLHASGSSRMFAQLLEVRGPQVVGDVVHRGLGEHPQRLGVDLQEAAPARSLDDLDPLGREESVRGLVGADGQKVRVGELGHRISSRVGA